MVYGCRKVDHVFERSISVDALAAGEEFMARFSANTGLATIRGRTWPLEGFARPQLLHFANARPLKLSRESVGV